MRVPVWICGILRYRPLRAYAKSTVMNEDRLIALETKLAYQEETVRVLNEVVTRQQQQIEALGQTCRQLAERIARANEPVFKGTLADEVPPHY